MSANKLPTIRKFVLSSGSISKALAIGKPELVGSILDFLGHLSECYLHDFLNTMDPMGYKRLTVLFAEKIRYIQHSCTIGEELLFGYREWLSYQMQARKHCQKDALLALMMLPVTSYHGFMIFGSKASLFLFAWWYQKSVSWNQISKDMTIKQSMELWSNFLMPITLSSARRPMKPKRLQKYTKEKQKLLSWQHECFSKVPLGIKSMSLTWIRQLCTFQWPWVQH